MIIKINFTCIFLFVQYSCSKIWNHIRDLPYFYQSVLTQRIPEAHDLMNKFQCLITHFSKSKNVSASIGPKTIACENQVQKHKRKIHKPKTCVSVCAHCFWCDVSLWCRIIQEESSSCSATISEPYCKPVTDYWNVWMQHLTAAWAKLLCSFFSDTCHPIRILENMV